MGQLTGRVRLNRDMRMDFWWGDSVHLARYFQTSSRTLLKRVPYWSKRVSTFGSSGPVMTRFHNVTLVW